MCNHEMVLRLTNTLEGSACLTREGVRRILLPYVLLLSAQSTSAAAKPGQRSVMMLDVSEAIQRKQRVGMQHRRGPVSSSPMHVSFSPGHNQAPQSPAPHQASATNSSPAQVLKQAHPQQSARSPGSGTEVPAGSGLSRTQMPLQAEKRQTEQPAASNGTAKAIARDAKVAEDTPSEPHCLWTSLSEFVCTHFGTPAMSLSYETISNQGIRSACPHHG